MKVLLDTHVFLWWITDSDFLSEQAYRIISDEKNKIFFSAGSGWEIAIKANLGKIRLPDSPVSFITQQLKINSFQPLPINLNHALHVYNLPMHHRDPFDRILVAQSQLEDLPILTSDPLIVSYEVQTIW